ncbi:MAG: biopolymer transporter ExbD [Candidatus Cloacimonetes bacterium]|nr:biopolymer transporter ExbD [Candidatus Cloacimonadota bacterium]
MRPPKRPIQLELAPMIDVIFLLLLFFMVSTVFRKDELALALNLPSVGGSSMEAEAMQIVIELSAEALAIDSMILPLEKLDSYLETKCLNNPLIEFRSARDTAFERTALILAALSRHQCTRLKIQTKPIEP